MTLVQNKVKCSNQWGGQILSELFEKCNKTYRASFNRLFKLIFCIFLLPYNLYYYILLRDTQPAKVISFHNPLDEICWLRLLSKLFRKVLNPAAEPLLRRKYAKLVRMRTWCIRTWLSIHPDLRWWCAAEWVVRTDQQNIIIKFFRSNSLLSHSSWSEKTTIVFRRNSVQLLRFRTFNPRTWWWNLEILLMWFSVRVGRGMRFRFRQIESECCYQTISTENHLASGGNEWRPCGPCARKTFCWWPLLCMT